MPKKIVVDPFFDGAAPPSAEAGANYAPIENTELNQMLPTGPGGLRGTVIPKAGEGTGGAPSGWKGLDQVRTEIHVDPDIPGQSVVVQIADLKDERIAAALRETSEVDPRIRISAVYNAIANSSRDLTPQEGDGAPFSQKAVDGVVGPLQAFNTTGAAKPSTEIMQVPDKMQATAPTQWVTFEIEGFGEHRAPYHRVIRSNNSLVLVYDTKCDGAQRFFPRTTDQPLGIHIAGESTAYYAHTTGIEFHDAGIDYCVLLIEREAPLSSSSDDTE